MKYRKKPVIIDAIQFDGLNAQEIYFFAKDFSIELRGTERGYGNVIKGIIIPTLEGEMTAVPGDWIIKGIKGEVYPCKPDIFEATYEKVGLTDHQRINREDQ